MAALTLLASVLQVAPARLAPAHAAPAAPPENYERADSPSARLAARELNHRILVTGLTTASSQTWVNPDGSLTSEVAPGPVRVLRSSGWQGLDTTLAQHPDGTVTALAVPDDLVINGGGGQFASLTDGDVRLGAGWGSALPAPSVSGSTATYGQVTAGEDLLVTATSDGFKYSIRLTRAPSVTSVSIPLALSGLTVSQGADGSLRFVDKAGRTRLVSRAPVMFDAQSSPQGQPTHYGTVTTSVSGGASPVLTISLDAAFLSAPGTVYPVTIDPGGSLQLNDDAMVDSGNPTTSYYGPAQFQVGHSASAGATNVYRSFYGFHTDPIAGKHVLSATLTTYESNSGSCTATPVTVWGTSSLISSSTSWNTQPSLTSQYASVTAAKGFDAVNCPAGNISVDVTGLAQWWATKPAGVADLALVAGSETDPNGWKLFNGNPTLSVTYNTPPDTPARLFPTASSKVGTAKVSLSARVTDPDGGSVTGVFDLQDVTAGTTVASGVSGSSVTSGAQSTWTANSLTNGDTYQWRVHAFDGIDVSPTTGWQTFTIDTTPVPAPVVVSTSYPPGVWSLTSLAKPNNFSWTTTSSDVSGWQTKLDNDPWSDASSGTSLTWNPAQDGWHTLQVRGLNGAGLIGPSASYSYATSAGGSYAGAVSSPADQQRTGQLVQLTAASPPPPNYPFMDFEYRLGNQAGWTVVPAGDATDGTGTNPSWPVPLGTSGSFPSWNWNLQKTVTAVGGSYGLVQVIACFYTSPAPTANGKACSDNQPVNVQYDPRAVGGSYASRPLGPGVLSLASGDFTVSSGDVNLPSALGALTVGRTYDTLNPTSINTGFGPGWVANLPGVDAGAADQQLADHTSAGFVTLTDASGNQSLYVTSGSVSSYPVTFTGLGDALDGSTLTKNDSLTFTLKGTDGTLTVWKSKDSGQTFPVDHVQQPTNSTPTGTTSTFVRDGLRRLVKVIGPNPQGSAVVDCTVTPMPAGCRSLSITYASSTTPGLSSSIWGDYTGNISTISYNNADPSTQTVSPVDVAKYSYDNTGRLRASWDPRISPALKTTYDYDSTSGRLSAVTPPGLNGWQLGYDSSGRLKTVARPDPTGGTDTSTVIYHLPLTGSGAPVDMSQAAGWNQTSDLPTTAAAIFPPTHPVTVSYDNVGNPQGLSNTDWPWASLSYLDVNGREVNSATFGNNDWQVSTTSYNQVGQPVFELSPENRDHAFGINYSGNGDQMDPYVAQQPNSATRADLLSTVKWYTDAYLRQSQGPTHPALADSVAAAAFAAPTDLRTTTNISYDQSSPGGAIFHLPTETQSYGTLAGSVTTTPDRRVTFTGYDPIAPGDPSGWTLRQPTTNTVQTGAAPSSADLTHLTRYNDLGQQVETRMPSDPNGTGAGTWQDTYYVVSGTGSCVNPASAGLICQKTPAAAPSIGPVLPTTTYTYDRWGNTLTSTDSNGSITRTTSYSYDPAGRLTGRQISVVPSQSAASTLPAVSYSYDPTTGLQTSSTTGTGTSALTLTTGYDSDGRIISYQDGTNPTATTSYDANSRVKTRFDGIATDTYSYDTSSEHRNLPTTMVDTQAGTFTATYNDNGQLSSQTYPSLVTAQYRYDDTGNPVSLTYGRGNSSYMAITRDHNGLDQVVNQVTPTAQTSYRYDPAGRLSTLTDIDRSTVQAICATRSYGYDPDSNRLSETDYPNVAPTSSNPGGCSTSTTPTVIAHSYDTADRVTSTGYSYDQRGRTTTLPASDSMRQSQTQPAQPISYAYYTDDTLYSETTTSAGLTQTTLYGRGDATGRITYINNPGSSDTPVYADNSDREAYDVDGTGSRHRIIRNITGDDTGFIDDTAGTQLQYPDLGGNILGTSYNTTTDIPGAIAGFTEFGGPRLNSTTNYGWLQTKDRPRLNNGGLINMGARIYNPTTGRFLQTDPIPGGSANPYDYAYQDPINKFDLGGTCWGGGNWCHIHYRHIFGHVLSTAGGAVNWASTVLPGPQALVGGEIGTIWQVAGERLQMDHYGKAERRRLIDQLEWDSSLNVLSAGMSRYGSRLFVHVVNSIANTNMQSAAMERPQSYHHGTGWDD